MSFLGVLASFGVGVSVAMLLCVELKRFIGVVPVYVMVPVALVTPVATIIATMLLFGLRP